MTHPSTRNALHTTMSDILAHNYPTYCQSFGYSGVMTLALLVICEVNTYTGYKTWYSHPSTAKLADKQAQIMQEYQSKFS